MTIWFSASCNLTILPNSVGLPALPLRMTSVVGSNKLTILPSAWVSPAKTRALVWRITCRTRGTLLSSCWRSPSSTACRRMSAARLTSSPISLAMVARDLHDPFMDLFDHLRSHRHAPTAHGLGVGHLGGAHPGEVAIHQIGPHLPFQHAASPVAHVLEHQQTQHHLGRGARPAAAAALRMPLGESLVDRRHDLLVGQHPIGMLHPLFVQILDLLGNQPVTKAALCPPRLNQGFFLARLGAAPSGRSSAWLSSQMSSSSSLSLW